MQKNFVTKIYFPANLKRVFAAIFLISFLFDCNAQVSGNADLYQFQNDVDARWSSPENPNGQKGQGGKVNDGAKGRPYITMHPGKSLELLNIKDQGIIRRIWITVSHEWQDPVTLRSLRIDMYWDGESKPAVSVPFGDFFGLGLCKTTVFENVFFANPEGKSFNCFIPMPFRTGARIVITNETENKNIDIYFDVDYTLSKIWDPNNLYFHAFWHRDTATTLGKDFEILPAVTGKGRFLGSNISVNGNPAYESTWFGEGEFKVYKDGDTKWPTLNGTGTEDFVGSGWGQKKFIQRSTGSTVADTSLKQWGFYRYHVLDPIFFSQDCRVSIQQLGGAWMPKAQEFQKSGVPMIPVTIEDSAEFRLIYNKENPVKLDTIVREHGWTNFYRSDDVAAVAYFYLDKPVNTLPKLQSVQLRTVKMR